MLEQRILEFFQRVGPVRPDDALLIAVSGGPDSIALLHLLLAVSDTLAVRLEVAHIDHGLRDADGEADAAFVSELAEREGLAFHRSRVNVPELRDHGGGSLEALARRERYRFLDEARGVAGARWIVTGHTADDQVETLLMNLLRGAGPRGLGGMLPTGPGARCRPLLGTWRAEIMEYLQTHGIAYRTDATNQDLAFTRNLIRHRLVPFLEKEFGSSVLRTLARESQLMNSLDDFLSLESDRILKELAQPSGLSGGEIRLNIPKLTQHHPLMQRSVLRAGLMDLAGGLEEITLSHVDDLVDLTQRKTGTGSLDLPHGLLARREYEDLVLCRPSGQDVASPPPPSDPLDLSAPGELRWGRFHLKWKRTATSDLDLDQWENDPDRSCFVDAATVPPVYLRSIQPGDRLQPLGMEGSQKVSDLLINRKVARHLRTWVPILCDNGGSEDGERILWVVGQRRSRHAPVEPETSQVVLFEAETIV